MLIRFIPVLMILLFCISSRGNGANEIRLLSPVNGGFAINLFSAETSAEAQGYSITFHPAQWPHVMEVYSEPQDWSSYGGISLDIRNVTDRALRLETRIDDDRDHPLDHHSSYGNISLAPSSKLTIIIPFRDTRTLGMNGGPPLPGAQMAMSNEAINWKHIVAWQLFMHDPDSDAKLIVSNARFIPPVKLDGIVDRFGQYSSAQWPGKVTSEEQLLKIHHDEAGSFQPAPENRDEYGGWKSGPQLKATGHFRTEKRDGRWWLVTPSGHLFYSLGVDTIHPWEATIISGRENMFSWLPQPGDPLAAQLKSNGEKRTFDFYAANLQRIYGKDYEREWRETTIRRLKSWGFNTIADWSDPDLFKMKKLPYVVPIHPDTRDLPAVKCAERYIPDVYDPRYIAQMKTTIKEMTANYKDDPWCIGFFVDNEIPWDGWRSAERYELVRGVLALCGGYAAKRAFTDYLIAKYESIKQLNEAWEMKAASWEEFRDQPVNLPEKLNSAQIEDVKSMLSDFARTYFSLVSNAVKTFAPNKLYLGSRIAGMPPVEVPKACAEYADVVSFNIYQKDVDPTKWAFTSDLGKPCIIGEFHFGALDRGMFHTGLGPVKDQNERAKAYVNYVRSVMRMPAFVGCHWFQYVDEPLTGRFDGENYNIGFVTVTDTPYPELVKAASELNRSIYKKLSSEKTR